MQSYSFAQLLYRYLCKRVLLAFLFALLPAISVEAEPLTNPESALSDARAGNRALQLSQFDVAIERYGSSLRDEYSASIASNLSRAHWLRSQKYSRLAAEAKSEGELSESRSLNQQLERDRVAAITIAKTIPHSAPLAYAHGLLTRHETGELSEADLRAHLGAASYLFPPQFLIRAAKVLDDPDFLHQALAAVRNDNGAVEVRAAIQYELGMVATDIATARQHFQTAALLSQDEESGAIHARSLYQLFEQTGDFTAIAEAVRALDRYRKLDSASGLMLEFEADVEPVYRAFVRELLHRQRYEEALQAIDRLLVAEVEFYLAADCFFDAAEPIAGTAIRYIALESELWVFLLKAGKLHRVERVAVRADELERLAREFRFNLEYYGVETYYAQAQQLYQFLIAPVLTDIGWEEELTIIADENLRAIPFAALHDGQSYLVERMTLKYGLQQVVRSQPLPKPEGTFLGLTVAIGDLTSLPHVARESELSNLEVLLDREASYTNLQSVLAEHPQVLHLATHARYSSLERSWIQLYDRRISAREFEALLHDSEIDLLVLAGCETAAGDRQAVLGLSSLAISTGIDRVLGSLWAYRQVEITELMGSFYVSLQKGLAPAEALQQAQLKAIAAGYHPSSWASLILVD